MKPSVIEAVTEMFIAKGQGHTVKEIAEFSGISEPKVRAVLNRLPDGIAVSNEYRPSYNKNYGMQSGYHKVNVYSPTKQQLASIIKSIRALVKIQKEAA